MFNKLPQVSRRDRVSRDISQDCRHLFTGPLVSSQDQGPGRAGGGRQQVLKGAMMLRPGVA